MVDNENQWKNPEYLEDSTEESTDYNDNYEEAGAETEDYSDENYEDDYETDDYPQTSSPKKNNGAVLIILVLLIALLGVGAFYFLNQNQDESIADNGNNQQQEYSPQNNEGNPNNNGMTDQFFNQSNGDGADMVSVDFNNQDGSANVTSQGENGEIVATVSEQPQENMNNPAVSNENSNNNPQNEELNIPEPNNTIMVSYNPNARQNPFKPPVINPKEDEAYKLLNTTGFEVIEPPVTSVVDENMTKLLQTQISGILYDNESPSAIVNLNGVDQFVKIGDTISGYKVENITKDKVQISYKNNSYVASVGELFVRGELDKQSTVANLESKFAGRYKSNNN